MRSKRIRESVKPAEPAAEDLGVNRIILKSCESMEEIQDGEVSLIVTSPPYWNAIDYDAHTADKNQWYRTRRGDEYQDYLRWLKTCFAESFRVLKPGGFCCVVIGTVLHNGEDYPLPQHFVWLMDAQCY